jgi:protein O-GlcNAc transferase
VNKGALVNVEQKLNQGRTQEARELCIELCNTDSKMPQAWSLLGIINGQLGMFEEAEKCFRKVIDLTPDAAEAYFNLAKAQTTLGQHPQAEQNYLRAIRINPEFVLAYNNLATLQVGLNKAMDAERHLRRAMEIKPDYPNPYHNLAILLQQQGRIDEAERFYRAVLDLQPDFSAARDELTVLLMHMRRYDEAEALMLKALQAAPADINLLFMLGKVYLLDEKFQKAEACYRKVLEFNPDHVEALIDLGAVKEKTGEPDVSLECYRKALALAPDNMRAHNNIAVALCLTGAYQEAVDAARKALAIKPDSMESYTNLANALYRLGHLEEAAEALRQGLNLQPGNAKSCTSLGQVLLLQGKTEEADGCYRRAIELQPELSGAYSALLYAMNFQPQLSRTELFRAHCEWAARHEPPVPETIHHHNNPIPERRLRVGYVSPDFRDHSVAFFFEPILQNHNRDAFEIFCYSNVGNPDFVTARLQGFSDHWRHCRGVADAELAQRITDDGIDILVDLAGHSADNRLPLFARRPAPLQVSYLGYPNTTGMQRIQYLITDRYCDPEPEMDSFYSERLLRLPGAFFCYQPPENSPDVTDAPVLKNGYITFASFNTLAKIGTQVVKLWSDVLKAVPDARLNFQCRSLNDPPTRAHYEELFASHAIDVARIRFSAAQDFDAYLADHADADIILDTFPWNGHTVSCHALWMGVPVIALAGDRHASRMGVSILANLGLDHCIADSEADYIAAAAELARNPGQLDALRQGLRNRMLESGLCDSRAFTRQLEAHYRSIWRHWCAGHEQRR